MIDRYDDDRALRSPGDRGAQRLKRWSSILATLVAVAGCSGSGNGSASTLATQPTPGTTPSFPLVSTLAGSGTNASVDGDGIHASFSAPSDIAIDPASGNVYVLESTTGSIRKIDPLANVSTVTRSLTSSGGLTYDASDGALYATEETISDVQRVATNGAMTRFAQVPTGSSLPPQILGRLSVSASGGLAITESRAGNVVVLSSVGAVSTTMPLAPGVAGICYDSRDGNTYVLNQALGEVDRIAGPIAVPLVSSASLQGASGITFDPTNGAFYVASPQKNQILRISNGTVSVFAGTGELGENDGPTGTATFDAPSAIVYSASLHALFVTDGGGNTVRELASFE